MALDVAASPPDFLEGGFCPLNGEANKAAPNQRHPLIKLVHRASTQEHTNLFFRHKKGPLPAGWSEGTFEFRGLEIPFYIAHAAKTNAVEAAVSGLKPDHAVSRKEIKSNKKNGITTIWLNLPNPGRSLFYMGFYRDLSDFFYTDPRSPLYTEFPADTPRMAKGHSTGGGILIDLATDPNTKNKYASFKLITGEAIFMDNANAARSDNWFLRNLFTAYATINQNKLPHETFYGLAYLNAGTVLKKAWPHRPDETTKIARFSFDSCVALYVAAQTVKEKLGHHIEQSHGIINRSLSVPFARVVYRSIENLAHYANVPSPEELMDKSFMSERGSPTYGQILQTRAPHRKVTDRIVNDPDIQPVTKMILFAGVNDPYSALKPQKDIAKALGIPIYLSPAQHGPFETDKHARKFKITLARSIIPDVAKLPKKIRQIEPLQSKKHWPSFDRLFVEPASHIGERFYAAASVAYNAIPSMPRPSLGLLGLHMPSLFSRKLP